MEKSKESKLGIVIAFSYIVFPFIIFLIGWCQPYISIPVISILFLSTYLAVHNSKPLWVPSMDKGSLLQLSLIFLLILVITFLSGIGGYSYQNGDHFSRNTIFRILVDHKWPVIEPQANGSSLLMTYYIGFWMPSALIGKIAGVQFGFFFQLLWAILGVSLFFYLICAWRKKIDFLAITIMLFFSGLDAIAYYGQLIWLHLINKNPVPNNILGMIFTAHMEWWAHDFQYSSNLTQLYHVFNQSLPIWIIIMLLLLQQNNKNSVFIMGLSLLTSILPFVGLIPVFLVFTLCDRNSPYGLQYRFKLNKVLPKLKDMLTFQNIMGGGCSGIISFLYLKNNSSGRSVGAISAVADKIPQNTGLPPLNPQEPASVFGSDWMTFAISLILFLILEVGFYAILLYKENKYNMLYWCILLMLIAFPLFRVGGGADFSMRASIPPLLILALLIIDKIMNSTKGIIRNALILLLVIGAITPLHELGRSVVNSIPSLDQTSEILTSDVSEEQILSPGNNFTSELNHNFFNTYILKR